MGKLTLLLVVAAVAGGTAVTFSTHDTLTGTADVKSGGQEDVVAREIAESGLNLALAQMIEKDEDGAGAGLKAFAGSGAYGGGTFESTVEVDPAAPDFARVTVTGRLGDAEHTIRNLYRFNRLDAPGPIWVDAPFATGTAARGARVTGRPVRFDPRQHAALKLESFLGLRSLSSTLGTMAQSVGNALPDPASETWDGPGGLLDGLNVSDTDGIYQTATSDAVFDPESGDRRLSGPRTVSGAVTWGGADNITIVDGDLTVTGHVTGSGVLVVGGGLRVASAGALTWRGLVLVRDTDQILPVKLDGRVTIDGALAVAHRAFPPGGHLDVSVYADPNGMNASNPGGGLRGYFWPRENPWLDHTHAFDQRSAGGGKLRGPRVVFLQNGGDGPYEQDVWFRNVLRMLGSTPVYLEFGNTASHGYATFDVRLQGRDAVKGSPRTGFPAALRHPDAAERSAVFAASDLRDLVVDVQSLRALRQSFDDETCGSWPLCIGEDWNRKGALALRVVRASDHKRLYEASLYWHMREDEVHAHEAAEALWRQKIASGSEYGAHLTLGRNVQITYDREPLVALVDKMGFDPDGVRLVGAASDHLGANATFEKSLRREALKRLKEAEPVREVTPDKPKKSKPTSGGDDDDDDGDDDDDDDDD